MIAATSATHGSPVVVIFLLVFVICPFVWVFIGAMLGIHDNPRPRKPRFQDPGMAQIEKDWRRRGRP